jgi:hypothetical protein
LGAWALLDSSFVRFGLWLGFSPHSAIRAVSLISMPVFAVCASGAVVFLIQLRFAAAIAGACAVFAIGLLAGALGLTLLGPADSATAHFLTTVWGFVLLVFAICTVWFALRRHA